MSTTLGVGLPMCTFSGAANYQLTLSIRGVQFETTDLEGMHRWDDSWSHRVGEPYFAKGVELQCPATLWSGTITGNDNEIEIDVAVEQFLTIVRNNQAILERILGEEGNVGYLEVFTYLPHGPPDIVMQQTLLASLVEVGIGLRISVIPIAPHETKIRARPIGVWRALLQKPVQEIVNTRCPSCQSSTLIVEDPFPQQGAEFEELNLGRSFAVTCPICCTTEMTETS